MVHFHRVFICGSGRLKRENIPFYLKVGEGAGEHSQQLHLLLVKMEGRFTGQVAVVTGSTAGIGLAIAKRLAQDGAHVVVSSRKAANVEKVVKVCGYFVEFCSFPVIFLT